MPSTASCAKAAPSSSVWLGGKQKREHRDGSQSERAPKGRNMQTPRKRTDGLLRDSPRPEALEVHIQAQHLPWMHDVHGGHGEGLEAPAHAREAGALAAHRLVARLGLRPDDGLGHLHRHVLHRELDHLAEPHEAVPGLGVLRDAGEGPVAAASRTRFLGFGWRPLGGLLSWIGAWVCNLVLRPLFAARRVARALEHTVPARRPPPPAPTPQRPQQPPRAPSWRGSLQGGFRTASSGRTRTAPPVTSMKGEK